MYQTQSDPSADAYMAARTAIHAAVDAVFDLIFLTSQQADQAAMSEPEPKAQTAGEDEARPDFSQLPNRRWQVIMSQVWNDPDAKYRVIADRAEQELGPGHKVTDKDIASYIYLANNGPAFRKSFVHPKRRIDNGR